MEKAASIIRTYEVQFVHGLLQTEDYARAVILIANARAPAQQIDRRVSVRMRRQQLLTQPDAPELWAVLDEAALRRSPDGRNSALYLDQPDVIDHVTVMDLLCVQAATGAASRDMLSALLKQA